MQTKITGHRGYPSVAPENTLFSFRAAVAAGAERIELDILPSRDGQLVVHHDYYLGRTNNGAGAVQEQDGKTLAELDAGAWFSDAFRGVRLCRLEDVLDYFGSDVEYEIESKGVTLEFLNNVVQAVQERGLVPQVEFTSPHMVVLQAIREICPEARRGIFLASYPGWMEQRVGEQLAVGSAILGAFSVAHCPVSILTQSLVATLHQAGIAVHAADCNDVPSLEMAYRLNVEQLSTNAVTLAARIRAEIQKKE